MVPWPCDEIRRDVSLQRCHVAGPGFASAKSASAYGVGPDASGRQAEPAPGSFLFMAECAVQVDAEAKAAQGERGDIAPVFTQPILQPVIESHGL